MFQHDLASLSRRCLNGEGDFKRRLAPAAVMHGLLASANGRREVVEDIAAPGKARPLRKRDLAPAVLSIEQDAVGGAAQFAVRTGRDGEAEMRLMRRLA